ncbi:hypothetical protein [Candidatus Ichthyocystis sparus]|uniref:hypothetical protein n=1 Tax=Candidatus Ichthyocystis sparus TaxID=1561004 RepID=UPI0011476816|nr:hypothetical protein [Candidatus Ichthyocystis sparus]
MLTNFNLSSDFVQLYLNSSKYTHSSSFSSSSAQKRSTEEDTNQTISYGGYTINTTKKVRQK